MTRSSVIVKKRILRIAFLCILLLGLVACSDTGNRPYEPDTPAPAAHEGVFVCEESSLAFNGDGQSIVLSLRGDISDLFELKEGEYEGSYVFLSGDLPPQGSVPVRYDTAHELKIDLTVNGEDYARIFTLGLASKDGKTATVGVDVVKENEIPFLFEKDGVNYSVVFVKE